MFAAVQDTRRQWETVTETTRRIAIAADTELRRRHPDLPLEPLRPHPAEAARPTPSDPIRRQCREAPGQPTLDRKTHLARHADHQPRSAAVSARHQDANGQLVLGLTTATAFDQIPEQVLRIRDNAKIAQAKLDDLAASHHPAQRKTARPWAVHAIAAPAAPTRRRPLGPGPGTSPGSKGRHRPGRT